VRMSLCGVRSTEVSLGTPAAVTHDRTVARRFHRTHKEGYRGSNYLWSGCFFHLCWKPLSLRRERQVASTTRWKGSPRCWSSASSSRWSWWRWKPPGDTRKSSAEAVGGRSGSGGAESARVREFAKSLGLLEKTDRIDAQVIARFAEVKKCEASVPTSAEQQCLKALSGRLQQLSRLAADQKNQRNLVDEPRVLRTFDAVLKVAKQQMREVEAEIAGLLASDPLWRKLEEALRSIKGVAGRTVARVLAGSAGDRNVVEQSGVEGSGSGTAGERQRQARRQTSGARRSPQCASACMWGPAWCADTTRTLQRLQNGCRPKENLSE